MKLAIVEDLEYLRTSTVAYFEEVDEISLVRSFSNGEDALEGIPAINPDVIIMDIGLPGISGIECMSKLKEMGLQSSFLMFTVFEHDEHLFEALKLGAAGYIIKGDGEEGLHKAIRDWKAGGAPMSHSIAKKIFESFQSPQPSAMHEGPRHTAGRTPKPELQTLSAREQDILKLIAEGLLNKEIADRLKIADGTVKQHNYNIYRKLNVNNRVEAIRKYLD